MPKSRIAIVGLGRIGGSIGLKIKQSKLDVQVIGHDKDNNVAGRAQKRGAVDETKWNLIDACSGAGLVILALPLDGIKDTLAALKTNLPSGVVITDTATTKTPVLEWAKDLPEGVHFVGGDPVLPPGRGGGGTGIDAADANLFDGATYCLVPSKDASAPAIETLSSFATMLGAKPYFIDAAEHDGLMTGVEHLPAALALALLSATIHSRGWREMSKLAGENFRASTGLAPQDAATAREQFFAHRDDLMRWIDELTTELGKLRSMIEQQDFSAIEAMVKPLAAERDKWLAGRSGEEDAPGDVQAVRFNPAHLLIGGLAERTPRKKN